MVGVRQFDADQAAEQALEVFWKKGFAQTSMQDLAEATGVLRGSLYNAYGDKETLFLAAYARYHAQVLTQTREVLDQSNAARALRDFFSFLIRMMRTGAPTRGCLTTKVATDETAQAALIRTALVNFLDSMEAQVAERLARPDAAAKLAVPPKDAARLVVTLTRGIVVMERVYQDEGRLKKTADTLVRMLLSKGGG